MANFPIVSLVAVVTIEEAANGARKFFFRAHAKGGVAVQSTNRIGSDSLGIFFNAQRPLNRHLSFVHPRSLLASTVLAKARLSLCALEKLK